MLLQLERHILTLNNFKLNPVTALDFLAYFFTDMPLHTAGLIDLSSDKAIDMCIPIIHYCTINYEIRSHCNLRTIALASTWVAL